MVKRIKDGNLLTKKILLLIADAISINLVSLLALFIRFELSIDKIDIQYLENMHKYLWIDTILTLLIFTAFGLYKGLWKYASVKELVNITLSCIVSYGVKSILTIWLGFRQPRSVIIYGWILLTIFVFLTRFSYRFLRYIINENIRERDIKRIMVIGAGDAGNMIIREIKSNRDLKKKIVCIIDDNKDLKGLQIHGIRIIGNRDNIIKGAEKYDIDEIIIAIPSAFASERRDIYNICKETGCTLKTIPGMYQLINNEVSVSDLKEVEIEDLLGREQIDINVAEIIEYVSGKTILVTGAGGSIGSELCRQIALHLPKKLIMLDIYENGVYDIQLELEKLYPHLDMDTLIADIKDEDRIRSILSNYKPDYIFHAAAHKHVPLMEKSPMEAIKNNVYGTLNLVQLAHEMSIGKFIMISTDKAVKPTSIMGASKRMCEMIIQAYDKKSETEFAAVRFGNVLGSNGSVIPIFKKQIEQGGPVTVTHRDITRFFMTIPEAVSLVLQAGYYASGGEIFILDMGEPVKIYDLAKNMIQLSGRIPDKDIKIEITGLRPGEKLYEELLTDEEGMDKTKNNLIFIAHAADFDADSFFDDIMKFKQLDNDDIDLIKDIVVHIIPSYTSTSND